MSQIAIGIDLGTTNSCVAIYQHGKVDIIENDCGNRIMPSYVAFTDEERLIGEAAKEQAELNPENTLFDSKRLLGRKFNDMKIQKRMKYWPFEVCSNGKKINVKCKGKLFSPEEISAMILHRMKETAERHAENVSKAVITVPAYFNNAQRQATIDAAKVAGLQVLRIINEPTAAAIAYGFDKNIIGKRNVLVFDLGGGTFDVSILTLEEGNFTVKSTAGNTYLGGGDFDIRMIKYFVKEFNLKHNKDITNDKHANQKLRTECEKAKKTLSKSMEAKISIRDLYNGINLQTSITRSMFEQLNSDLFLKTLDPVEKALSDAKMSKAQIHDVILVGGSTRIPKIQEILQKFFNGKKLNQSINPDEAVAYGAAIQAAILTGAAGITDLLIRDVTPLSLGINIKGDIMSVVIQRNTAIPVKQTEVFATSTDNQKAVKFSILQGERSLTKDNYLLGEFTLTDITEALSGVTKMDVTFSIDENGVLNVVAIEKLSGEINAITIDNNGSACKAEINQMIKDFEKYRIEDEIQKNRILAKNKLDQ